MGVFIGVEIPENVFGEGLIIHHNGSIVVNGSSKVGKNCQLHGDNCIGNVGKSDSLTDCPQIGNNVEIGVGAKVLGGIIIADNIKIGANAHIANNQFALISFFPSTVSCRTAKVIFIITAITASHTITNVVCDILFLLLLLNVFLFNFQIFI